MPLMVTIQQWSLATNIHKQYGVYFVCHRQDLNMGTDNESRYLKIDALDRSAMIGYAPVNQCFKS